MAFSRELVALTIYCEASNATPEERRCIAWSIFNRWKLRPRYGNTEAAVVLRRYQYSEWNDDPVDNKNLLRAAEAADTDPILLDCLESYDQILDAGAKDITYGATHYHDKTIPHPPFWTINAIRTRETNKFVFYKNVA